MTHLMIQVPGIRHRLVTFESAHVILIHEYKSLSPPPSCVDIILAKQEL